MRKLASIVICLVFCGSSLVHAQSEFYAVLASPQTSQFPILTTTLEVFGPGDTFVHGLIPDQVTLLENGQRVAIEQLRETQVGVEFIVAVNAGSPLALRDSSGRSRYQKVSEVLQDWANAAAPSSLDRFNLVVNDGLPVTSLTERNAWLEAFDAYQPDLRNSTPSLQSLEDALSMVNAQKGQRGLKATILYITPPPVEGNLAALPGLIERAAGMDARLHVWMVASENDFNSRGAQELQRLASETRGRFIAFSGTELLSDPEDYLGPLRSQYQLTYSTAIRKGGSHTLAAEIQVDEGLVTSAVQTFELNVQPPNPMFISPPALIVRTSPPESENPLQELGPMEYPLQALIEFPDGFTRPLAFTRLYIDGKQAAEQTTAPFDRFAWNLGDYTTSGQHTLRLEVEDRLGMRKSSLEIPVEIKVQLPTTSFWTGLVRKGVLVNAAAVILAGASLTLVFTLANNKRRGGNRGSGGKNRKSRYLDPLTQPVRGTADANDSTASSWQQRLPWPKPVDETVPMAYLLRLGENNEPVAGAPIPIHAREMTIGRDPTQATCILDAVTVDGLHARLRLTSEGSYVLNDENSVAGTWVNFAPISGEGIRLEHGDILHFGRLTFRFSLSKPDRSPKITIRPYEDEP